MAEKNATIRVSEELTALCEPYGSISQGVKSMIEKLQTIKKLSANELRGKFTESEWKFLAASLNGSINDETLRYRAELLCYHNEDSERYEGTASQFGIKLSDLNAKIRQLTAAQLDALYTRVEYFWDNSEKIELDAWAKF